jgi:hypothetical protein
MTRRGGEGGTKRITFVRQLLPASIDAVEPD